MASFSFSFAGDDIDDTESAAPVTVKNVAPAASAFPVQGKPQLPPQQHNLTHMLSLLPSKVAYGLLEVTLDDGRKISMPRRELWDVRVQLMAEEEEGDSTTEGLGQHDVKTGVYEGGFKSWESSVDLVKVLATHDYQDALAHHPVRVIEVRKPGPVL
jgi:protein-histidine N-methyltransferase